MSLGGAVAPQHPQMTPLAILQKPSPKTTANPLNTITVCNRLCVEAIETIKDYVFNLFLKAFRFSESFTLLGKLLNNLSALYLKLLALISLFILGSFSL